MDKKSLNKAIRILKTGGVIAFPTETVYGIGAALNQPAAIKRIYKIKNRPINKPLQVLVSTLEEAKRLGVFNKQALSLAKAWPGPLTLVVNKTKLVPKLVTGGAPKVGLRIPDHQDSVPAFVVEVEQIPTGQIEACHLCDSTGDLGKHGQFVHWWRHAALF